MGVKLGLLRYGNNTGWADSFSTGQEILDTLWNLKVHYNFHKSPPLVPVWARLIQSMLSHPISLTSISRSSSHLYMGLQSCLFFNIYLPNSCMYFLSPPCMLHVPLIWWAVQIMKFLTVQFPPASCYFLPLRPNYIFLSILLLKAFNLSMLHTSQWCCPSVLKC